MQPNVACHNPNHMNLPYELEVGLRYKVTDWASRNMKAEKDSGSGADSDLDETRYSIGFGVGW